MAENLSRIFSWSQRPDGSPSIANLFWAVSWAYYCWTGGAEAPRWAGISVAVLIYKDATLVIVVTFINATVVEVAWSAVQQKPADRRLNFQTRQHAHRLLALLPNVYPLAAK